ncbi:MAG TPA: urease accessory protein UreD [Gemmatimonadales bacterium]|nr:urease accessory protein UreD [Gemmatimonadales bacterium]
MTDARDASSQPGRAELEVIPGPRGSVVSRALAASPLRLLTPANHGRAAWIYTSTFGGGMVDGDAIAMRVVVGQGAAALLSTQASTKVYRSPRGCEVELQAEVERDGLLVVLPDPVVCFAASSYRQVQRVDVAAGARLVLVDWMTSGRRASGERWAFAEYVSRTVVRYGGRLLLHDGTALRASDGDLAARMGRFDVLALVVIAGAGLQDDATALVSSVNGRPIVRGADELVAAAPLRDCGCVVRVAGRSVEQVGRRLRRLLRFVPALLGDDPWSRKW